MIKKIEGDVEDEVIPVSTGIYSEEKLIERLQAIPKPIIEDYDDCKIALISAIFFEVSEKGSKCNL